MKTKVVILIIASVLVISTGVWVVLNDAKDNSDVTLDKDPIKETSKLPEIQLEAPKNSQNSEIKEEVKTPPPAPPTPPVSKGTFSEEEDLLSTDVAVFKVVYDGASFAPKIVNARKGDIVVFENSSLGEFWVASDPHPTHTGYPEFNSDKGLPPGESFSFKFEKSGTFGYHNHLNSSIFGEVVVK